MGKTWERKKIKSVIFNNYSPVVKNFRLPGKKMRRAAETSFYVSIGSIWSSTKKRFKGKFTFNFFGQWMKELHFFIEHISANLFQKGILCVHRNILKKRNSDKPSLLQQFWTLNKKIGLLSKIFGAVIKTAFCVSLGPFWGKIIIEKTVIYNQFWTLSNFFDLLSKFWVEVVKNAIYVCA